MLSAWRDTDYFTEAERAALAITEEITLIADVTSGRRAVDEEHPELTDAQVAAVRWLGISINSFNRLSITSHHPVDPDTEPAPAAAAPRDSDPGVTEALAEFDEADNRDS